MNSLNFSVAQLKDIMQSEKSLEDFFNSTAAVREAQSVQEELMSGNVALASTLCARGFDYSQLRKKHAEQERGGQSQGTAFRATRHL